MTAIAVPGRHVVVVEELHPERGAFGVSFFERELERVFVRSRFPLGTDFNGGDSLAIDLDAKSDVLVAGLIACGGQASGVAASPGEAMLGLGG